MEGELVMDVGEEIGGKVVVYCDGRRVDRVGIIG